MRKRISTAFTESRKIVFFGFFGFFGIGLFGFVEIGLLGFLC